MNFNSKFLTSAKADEDSQFQEIDNPLCTCGHMFNDHDRHCDHCEDCPGYFPASMEKQVAHVCEYRSFSAGKGHNPIVYARDPKRQEGVLKVYFSPDMERVLKAEYTDRKGGETETREGWEGFFSFTQAHGD
jgi:hypothetical protein